MSLRICRERRNCQREKQHRHFALHGFPLLPGCFPGSVRHCAPVVRLCGAVKPQCLYDCHKRRRSSYLARWKGQQDDAYTDGFPAKTTAREAMYSTLSPENIALCDSSCSRQVVPWRKWSLLSKRLRKRKRPPHRGSRLEKLSVAVTGEWKRLPAPDRVLFPADSGLRDSATANGPVRAQV